MNEDITTSFLTYYVRSLSERTREEKTGTKFGFDWIIYNLALADELIPYRLPFIRSGPSETSRTKTEAEFGVDLSFISPDRKILHIFVLKDEELKNATWNAHNFDSDLRNAACPNLDAPELREIEEVRVILAYNKDEDKTGIQLFENLTKSLGTIIRDKIKLTFERWNLTTITEKAKAKLLTPSLLPQKFFSHFSYILSQFADFRHGSDEWVQQLTPNWRRFLSELLKGNVDERNIRLVPVALIILREHGQNNPSGETGWFDLAEWAVLAAWEVLRTNDKEGVQQAVCEIWLGMYLPELELYYRAYTQEIAMEHSLESRGSGTYLDAIAASIVANWHIARLGVMGIGFIELPIEDTEECKQAKVRVLNEVADWLTGLMNANPSAMRPILDIHHIEQYLIWRTFWQVGRLDSIHNWLFRLERSLLIRRAGTTWLPLPSASNSLEFVFEYLATTEKPPEYNDQSSLLLLCLIEFAFSLPQEKRDKIISMYYKEIVIGQDSFGHKIEDVKPIDLMVWAPPDDWATKILTQRLNAEGESQVLSPLESQDPEAKEIISYFEQFITLSRQSQKFEFPAGFPTAILVLACLKHQSPLPPEFWRTPIFDTV